MISSIAKKILGSRNKRLLKRLWPIVEQVNQEEEKLQELSDSQLQAKTEEFRERLQQGETTDDIMVEAFAVVKNTCRRLYGQQIEITGSTITWDMVPFDVQILGAIAMHQGNIAEMATGEGKTLVATMPLYLNALTGKNCQLITVNDYLARRDSQWMGAVYEFLGLTVGCIQNSMRSDERRQQYACDITYGTNNEFGFDYLRDMGMAKSADQMVQRDYFYAIIDEIDSILIDEARTPLIISGPATVTTHRYDKLKPKVEELFRRQSTLCARLVDDAKKVLMREDATAEERNEAIVKLVQARMGMPKQKQMMRLLEEPGIRKEVERQETQIQSETNTQLQEQLREELYFVIDERGGDADLTEKGRVHLSPDDPDAFVIPDIAERFSEIDADDSLSESEKTKAREEVQRVFDEQSEIIHNISQLLRAYCLFEKDVQYVVQDNKVIIVDEFTGRLMPGRRFSEGLHQALEAKEGVQIERETQTLASITIQNYFRMYEKLSGMTGTAETEANEFHDIYNLDVVVIPTHKPCIRYNYNDRIYNTKREKYNAVANEIQECHERGQPALVGTVSVDVSEIISRMLRRKRIPHNVLNAKNHAREAEIIARAGQRGAVTIATNMAGRGTDIKLGEGVEELGGLHVIGSARHDARRIDRQLRGRCARQGEPGSSRFYVSLEDDLMRLFGSDRITSIMNKMGIEEGQELSHGMLSRSIERAQRRIEEQHFAQRKKTLDYDDVMNKQREVVYDLRKNILTTEDPRGMLFDFVYTAVAEHVETAEETAEGDQKLNLTELNSWLSHTFPISFKDEDFEVSGEYDSEKLCEHLVNRIDEAYQLKEKTEDPEALRWLERQIMLSAIDRLYQEHLYAMDDLRHAVMLRAYGQRDPLVEYKQEAYGMFSGLLDNIKEDILNSMFRSTTNINALEQALGELPQKEQHDILGQFAGIAPSSSETGETGGSGGKAAAPAKPVTVKRSHKKVGRNEPCPCGSGKKYKQCCGRGG
ncbi:MAG: preprotein translocase subunit SecA [Verrucomicrobiota bacterium]